MKSHLYLCLLMLLMCLADCAPPAPAATQGTITTATPARAVVTATPFDRQDISNQPSATPLPYLQAPGGSLTVSLAITRQFLRSARIEQRGSPPHPVLVVEGLLNNSCQKLRIKLLPPDQNGQILVTGSAGIGPATDCRDGDFPIEQAIEIGPYPQGSYTIWLNGENLGEVVFR